MRNPFDIDAVTKRLADNGQIIEAGWTGLRLTLLQDAPEEQVREMRKAFFGGAQHLFASICSFLEAGDEPTPNDLRRIEMISVELDAYVDELKREARGIY